MSWHPEHIEFASDVYHRIYACDLVFLLTPFNSTPFLGLSTAIEKQIARKQHDKNRTQPGGGGKRIGKAFLTRQPRKIIYCQSERNSNVWSVEGIFA